MNSFKITVIAAICFSMFSCEESIDETYTLENISGNWNVRSVEPLSSNPEEIISMEGIIEYKGISDMEMTISIEKNQFSFLTKEKVVSTETFILEKDQLSFNNGENAQLLFTDNNNLTIDFSNQRYSLVRAKE